MRILQIVPSLIPESGGPARAVPALCRAIARAGHQVALYTTDWVPREVLKRKLPQRFGPRNNEYTVTTFPCGPFSGVINLPASSELLKAVSKRWREFDVIHVHSLWNPVATFVMRKLRKNGANYCVTPRGMLEPVSFERSTWKKIIWACLWERANVKKAALVHFTTVAEEQKARRMGWPMGRAVVFPNFVDLEEWKGLPPPTIFEERFPHVRGKKVVLFVGRIHPIKNLDKLVDAMATVRRSFPNAMLVCAGPESNGLQSRLEQRAVPQIGHGHILFTGILEGEALKAAYSRADVFAMVSKMESFGMAAAEALACGLPMVLSHGVNLGKDLPDGGPILHVTPEPDEIGEALVTLLRRLKEKGLPDLEAQALAERTFGVSSVTKLLDAYASVMTGNG